MNIVKDLHNWFVERPHLKMPPILVVMTHIDLLTPAMEWAPPYDWRHPTRVKENNIAASVEVVRQQLDKGSHP